MAPVHMYNTICEKVPPLPHPARTYALAIIVAVVTAHSVMPDEHLHPWVLFVEGALILAVCVLVLEASMLVMLPAVQAQFKLEDLSGMMAWLAVISGACGHVARLIECSREGTETHSFFRMLGLYLVIKVLTGSFVLIVLAGKWQKRD